MITIDTNKFDCNTNSYKPHSKQQVTAEQAQQIIDIMKKKVVVEGFYEHRFSLNGQVLAIYTLHVDLKGFIESFKQPS